MHLIQSGWQHNPEGYYRYPVKEQHYIDKKAVRLFDQQGYAFTRLEREHAITNGWSDVLDLHQQGEWTIKMPWYDDVSGGNLHLNHAMLIERKGFADEALNILKYYAQSRPQLWKLVKMQPKWGIDLSIDYSARDAVFEVFHFEWDSFDLDEVLDMKYRIEEFIDSADMEHMAESLWDKRHEWNYLDYDQMSNYKCDFFGIPRERYKMANWHNERLY